jgi:single-stranded DNA-specific DHH superfamily exonuclease
VADGSASVDFLNVSRSLSGRRWRARPAEEGLVREHRARLGLDETMARALASRGVSAEAGPAYLRPTLKALFPDPSSFVDMDEAAAVLVDALEQGRPTVVFADYDVDGASSAALLVRWWREMGRELPIYVPDRMTEGYGPSPAAFRRLREEGYELVVTVDCGAAAYDAVAEARDLAQQLHALNAERKSVETEIFEQARAAIEAASNFDPEAPAMVVAQEGWHPGVIGIVASRLRERYRRPVVVIGLDRAGDIGKGSGRSQPGVNLGRAVQAAYEEGLLLTGGGHAMAAGLSLRPSAVPEFRAFLIERLAGEMETAQAEDALDIDALVTPGAAARPLYDAFQALAPFGPGNPEPTFALADVRVERPRPMTGGHLRFELADARGQSLRAVAWRCADTPIGRRLAAGGGSVHAAGRLKPDDWKGRGAVEIEIDDLADPRMS